MNPATAFTQRLVAELGELNFQLLRKDTELEFAQNKIQELEAELNGYRSQTASTSEVQQ